MTSLNLTWCALTTFPINHNIFRWWHSKHQDFWTSTRNQMFSMNIKTAWVITDCWSFLVRTSLSSVHAWPRACTAQWCLQLSGRNWLSLPDLLFVLHLLGHPLGQAFQGHPGSLADLQVQGLHDHPDENNHGMYYSFWIYPKPMAFYRLMLFVVREYALF